MRITPVNSYNYRPQLKSTQPIPKDTSTKTVEQKFNKHDVNFSGHFWKLSESACWAFIGGLAGGPIGAAVGAAIGAAVGTKMDDEQV